MSSTWTTKPLGDVVGLRRGFDLPNASRVDGPYPIISAGAQVGTHDEAKVQGPGFAVGRATNLGVPQWSDIDFWPLNTTLYAEDFKGNDPRWLYRLFQVLDLTGFDSGSVQPMLNRNYIAQVPVSVPPLAEQQGIAETLGALDDKIAANRRVIDAADNLLSVRSAVLRAGASSTTRLGELMRFNYGKALPAAAREPGDVAVVGSGGIVGSHKVALMEGPTVVIGRKGSVGATYWIDGPVYAIDTTYWVEPLEVSLHYAYYLLRSIDFESMSTDSAVPGLNRSRAYALDVEKPDAEELARFDRFAEPITVAMGAARVANETLAKTRDELLPLLMSGRITVKDAEKRVEGVV